MNIKTPIQIANFLRDTQHLFDIPESYYGDEPNAYNVEAAERWEKFPDSLRILWMALWPYSQFTGNQTIPLLYKLMYDYSDEWISERSHIPNTKRECSLYCKHNIPVFSLETKHSAGEFDVLGTSLGYPPFFFNLVQQLKWSGIPVRWKDRVDCQEAWPLIIAGGSIFANPLPWSPVVDIVFIGEAEEEENNPGIQSVFKDIAAAKESGALYAGGGREDLLHQLACTYNFLYIPRFIRVLHDDKTKLVTGFEYKYDDIPKRIDKRVVWDMNKVPCINRAMIPAHDPTMGPGEIEVARGCPAHCTFCAVTFRYAPYRERTVPYMVKYLAESVMYSGSNVAFPCSFEFGSYSRKKTLLKELLETVTDYVDTQSMRVDSISKDPDFTQVAGEAGMKQLVLGIEGNSQRLREFVNKGINEEQILKACENGFKAGFNKVKLYMIADLPYEDERDTAEIIGLCEKIVNLRDSLGVSAQIRCSWTPLLVEAQTPLQWYAVTVDERKLKGVYEGMRKLGVGFSLGKKTEVNYTYFTQLFHLSDDIAAEAILEVCETVDDGNAVYLGSVNRNVKEALAAALFKRGVSFDFYFCEKDGEKVDSYIFAWDFIFVRTAKKYLHRIYKQSKELMEKGRNDKWGKDFIDRKGICSTGCDACAGCDAKIYSPKDMIQLWEFEDGAVSLGKVKPIDQTTIVQRVRFKVKIDTNKRFIPNVTWQFIVRRAAFINEIPITKRTIRFASDVIRWKNWAAGEDYCEFGLTKKIILDQARMKDMIENLNEHLVQYGFEMLEGIVTSIDGVSVVGMGQYNLYEIPVNIPVPTIQKIIEDYHTTDFWEVVLKENQYRAGIVRNRVNLKDFVRNVWAIRDGIQVKLRLLIKGKASPFDALCSLFHIREMDSTKHHAIRTDIFQEYREDSSDFFINDCVECGDTIAVDLFDKPFHDELCPCCLDQKNGEVLARQVVLT